MVTEILHFIMPFATESIAIQEFLIINFLFLLKLFVLQYMYLHSLSLLLNLAASAMQQAALALVTLLPPGSEHLALAALTFALSTPLVQQTFEAASKHLSGAGPAVSPAQLCIMTLQAIVQSPLCVAVTPSSSSDLVMTRNPAHRTVSFTAPAVPGWVQTAQERFPIKS